MTSKQASSLTLGTLAPSENVDVLLYGVLLHTRAYTGDPSWSFSIGITNCVLDCGNYPPDLKTFLPNFQATGGTVANF